VKLDHFLPSPNPLRFQFLKALLFVGSSNAKGGDYAADNDPWAFARKLHATALEASPLPTPTAGSQPRVYPGVAELMMAHTLMAVAGDDAEMRLWASDMGSAEQDSNAARLGR
jgi:hypothetical protein